MPTRQDSDIKPVLAQSFPGLHNLVRLERVAFAAHEVERHGIARSKKHTAQIPAIRMGLVLINKAGGVAHESRALTPTDRFLEFPKLLGCHVVFLRPQPADHLVEGKP